MSAPSGDSARVTVRVAAPAELAFEVFTTQTDLWWRRGIKYRHSGKLPGVLHFEPGVGGRLFETFGAPPHESIVVTGRVLAWEPPSRLLLEWRNENFAPDEKTEVEVRFAPVRGGTLVTVEHRGWSHLRPDHPARHGLVDGAFAAMIGGWWGELLGALREHVAVSTS